MGPRGSAPVPASGQDLGLPGFFVFASVHMGFGPGRFEDDVLFWEGGR